MKKNRIIIGVVLGAVLLLAGCESDGKRVPPTPTEPRVDFDLEGKYDLANYLFPHNKFNVYSQEKKIDIKGPGTYKSSEKESSVLTYAYRIDDRNATVEVSKGDVLEKKYMIQPKRIMSTEPDINRSIEIARHIDVGDYVVKNNFTVDSLGNTKSGSKLCKIKKHIEQFEYKTEEFVEALVLSCSFDENTSFLVEHDEDLVVKKGTYEIHLGKGIGMVREMQSYCTTRYFDDLSDDKTREVIKSTCVKSDIKLLTQSSI